MRRHLMAHYNKKESNFVGQWIDGTPIENQCFSSRGVAYDLSQYTDQTTMRFAMFWQRPLPLPWFDEKPRNYIKRIEVYPPVESTSCGSILYGCGNLEYADLSNIELLTTSWYRPVTNCEKMQFFKLRGFGYGENFSDNIAFANCNMWGYGSEENRQSVLYTLLEHSYDRVANGWPTYTIKIPPSVYARLTEDEIAAIESKGYSLKTY